MLQKDINLDAITISDTSPIPDGSCIVKNYLPEASHLKFSKLIRQEMVDIYLWFSLFSVSKRKPSMPNNPACVVVAAGSNLGGAIISLPLLEAVRNRWPKTHLVVIANTKHGLEIAKFSGIGDSFYVAPTVSFLRSFFSHDVRSFRNKLKQHLPDIFVSNSNFTLDHLLVPLSIPIRIGHVGIGIYGDPINWGGIFNIPVACERGSNWLDTYSDIARTFQSDILSSPLIHISPNAKNVAKRRLIKAGLQSGERPIAIQASVWEKESFKQWPLESLVKVCKNLFENHKLIPVILGVSGEESIVRMLLEVLPKNKVIDFIGKTSPGEAAALMHECYVCIANDSGLMHLSAAVGTPTVFLLSISELTWVYGNSMKNRIVRNNSCKPCYAINRNLVHKCTRPCLTSIHPKTVIDAVLEALSWKESMEIIQNKF